MYFYYILKFKEKKEQEYKCIPAKTKPSKKGGVIRDREHSLSVPVRGRNVRRGSQESVAATPQEEQKMARPEIMQARHFPAAMRE